MEKSDTLHIYTDASHSMKKKKKNLFGMGAVIITDEKDYKISIRATKSFLSDYTNKDKNKQPTIHTAEAYMIYEVIKKTSHIRNKTIRIYSDSMLSLIGITRTDKLKAKQKRSTYFTIIDKILTLISELESDGYKIDFRWVRAHVNNYGNEVADDLAKYARNVVPDYEEDYFMKEIGKTSVKNTMGSYLREVV